MTLCVYFCFYICHGIIRKWTAKSVRMVQIIIFKWPWYLEAVVVSSHTCTHNLLLFTIKKILVCYLIFRTVWVRFKIAERNWRSKDKGIWHCSSPFTFCDLFACCEGARRSKEHLIFRSNILLHKIQFSFEEEILWKISFLYIAK